MVSLLFLHQCVDIFPATRIDYVLDSIFFKDHFGGPTSIAAGTKDNDAGLIFEFFQI